MAIAKLANFIAAPPCVVCKNVLGPVCANCVSKLFVPTEPVCIGCGTASELGRTCPKCATKNYLTGLVAPFLFSDKLKDFIHVYKYEGDRSLAKLFAEVLAPHAAGMQFDELSFVSSTGARTRQRGFNQAELLAKKLGKKLELKPKQVLIRRYHEPQVGNSREQRIAAVENNFEPIAARVRGRSILLIDDVATTGATLNECARVLRGAGAREVWGLVLARA